MPRFKARTFANSIDVSTNAGILVANSSSLNPTDFVALEIWVMPRPGTNVVMFDNTQAGATFSYFLTVDGTGLVAWFSTIGGIGRNITTGTGRARLNDWNLVSAAYDGSLVSVWINGVLVNSLAASGAMGVNSGQLRIGQYFNGGVPIGGLITQPRIYHRVYTITDHQNRYFNNVDNATMRLGLVLDMPMTEGSGTSIADVSGSANNGTYSRNQWRSDVPYKERTVTVSGRTVTTDRPVSVNKPNSLSFNGTTSFGSTPSVNFGGTNQFTVKGWFNFPSLTSPQVVLEQSTNFNTANAFAISVDSTTAGANKLAFSVHGNTLNRYSICASLALTAGVWYYITLTFDGTLSSEQAKAYVNAVVGSGYFLNQQITDNIANNILYFAARNLSSLFAGFKVRDFEIITGKAYSQAEVTSDYLFQGGVSGGTRVLVLSCNETSGTTAADSSGNGYTLTTGGGASFVAQGPVSRTLIS